MLSLKSTACLILAACLLRPANVWADVILFDGTLNASVYAPAPLGITTSLAPSGFFGGGTIEGDIIVTAPTDGLLTIMVTDQGSPGNVFEVVLDQASLGTTTGVPVGGPTNSSGTFTSPVAQGDHDIGLWDFVLSYFGDTSPYGGTVQSPLDTPQPVLVTVTEATSASVPEPGSLALLAVGLVWTVYRRIRKP